MKKMTVMMKKTGDKRMRCVGIGLMTIPELKNLKQIIDWTIESNEGK